MIRTASWRHVVLLGSLSALAAAFCYGSAALVAHKVVTDFAPPIVGTSFSMLFGTIILATVFYRHVPADVSRAPRRAWVFVAMAALTSSWGVSFWFLALNEAPVVLVAPLVGISPLVSIVLVHIFLQRLERVTWRTVAGALFVLAGVTLIAAGRG